MDGVVFAVDGEQFPSRFRCGGHDQFACSDEDFLVGESHGAAEFYGFISGFEADYTDGGGEDDFGGRVGADGEHAFAAVVDFGFRLAGLETGHYTAVEFIGEFFIRDGDEFGVVALDLGEEFVQIVAGGEGHDFELIGKGFDDVQSLAADRAGGAEDGERFHGWICGVSMAIATPRLSV